MDNQTVNKIYPDLTMADLTAKDPAGPPTDPPAPTPPAVPAFSTQLLDIAKKTATQVFAAAQEHGLNFAAECARKKALDAFTQRVNPHILKCVKANSIWNAVLFVMIIFNNFVFAPKLFLLYFVASYSTTFYGINNILNKIDGYEPILNLLAPKTIGKIRFFFNSVSFLMAVELVGICFNWGGDLYIYIAIIALVLHTFGIKVTQTFFTLIIDLMNSDTTFRKYIYIYLIENIVVICMYGLMQ